MCCVVQSVQCVVQSVQCVVPTHGNSMCKRTQVCGTPCTYVQGARVLLNAKERSLHVSATFRVFNSKQVQFWFDLIVI